jgi:hypothetical protein
MQNKSGVNPRNLNPMSVPGLSDEARRAVNAAFDAMSTWCIEIAKQQREEQRASHRQASCRRPGPSKSWMPPARSFRASRKCRSK